MNVGTPEESNEKTQRIRTQSVFFTTFTPRNHDEYTGTQPTNTITTHTNLRNDMRTIARLFIITAMLALAGAMPLHAQQKVKQAYIIGQVKNALTHERLDGARLTLMTTDSAVVDSSRTNKNYSANGSSGIYWLSHASVADNVMPDYIIKVEMAGYETAYVNVPHKTIKSRGTPTRYLDPIMLRRKRQEVELGEVVVTQTKVKFYNHGDTLVYNADAFQLANGSMLDNLIRQLPGAELRDNGQIYVNGRFIDNLLLNGEDFVKGNNQIMLDNLPAYMVKNVKVYEKASLRGEMLKGTARRLGDETYVMDIRLKRDYQVGWIGNAEIGGGNHDRWLARLFATRFTSNSRVTLFANANNLNDTRRPGESTTWTPDNMAAGNNTSRMAGLTYFVKDRDEKFKLSGSATITHNDEYTATRLNTENYIDGGNTWTRLTSDARNHSWSFTTHHGLSLQRSRQTSMWLTPEFSYKQWRNRQADLSATFNADPSSLATSSAALLDSIRDYSTARGTLRRLITNRYLNNVLQSGHATTAHVDYTFDHYFDESLMSDLTLTAGIDYSATTQDQFSQYRLDYPSSGAQTDYRYRYGRTRPNRHFNYNASAEYDYWFDDYVHAYATYRIRVNHRDHDYLLYRLDQLAGYGADDGADNGTLPSMSEYAQTIDLANSFSRGQTDVVNEWTPSIGYSRWLGDDKDLDAFVKLQMTLTNSNMQYRQGSYDGRFHRRTFFFQPSLYIRKMWDMQNKSVTFRYDLRSESPDLVRFIDVPNDEDPLYVTHGNPYLKNTHAHTFELGFNSNDTKNQRSVSAKFNAWLYQNQTAMGYAYDRTTGVRTFRPYSVDGNRVFQASVSYSTPLDKTKHLTLDTRTRGSVSRNVDLMSTIADGTGTDILATEPPRSVVTTSWFDERLNLKYQLGKVTMGINGYALYWNSRSHREGFTDSHVWNFNYGPTIKADLPWGLQVSSDLSVYSRRGYEDASANTNDVVWNARLSKEITKAHLTLMLDGFDMLHQLSNVSVTMNGQGRTETYRNVLPRYFLFHVVYKFSKK